MAGLGTTGMQAERHGVWDGEATSSACLSKCKLADVRA